MLRRVREPHARAVRDLAHADLVREIELVQQPQARRVREKAKPFRRLVEHRCRHTRHRRHASIYFTLWSNTIKGGGDGRVDRVHHHLHPPRHDLAPLRSRRRARPRDAEVRGVRRADRDRRPGDPAREARRGDGAVPDPRRLQPALRASRAPDGGGPGGAAAVQRGRLRARGRDARVRRRPGRDARHRRQPLARPDRGGDPRGARARRRGGLVRPGRAVTGEC